MNTTLLTDLALAPVAGYVGTKVMEPVSSKLYELESEQDRKREDEARPGAPYAIAARKTTDLLELTLTQQQMHRLALVFHYGLASSGPRCTPCCAGAPRSVPRQPASPPEPRCR